MYPYVHMINQGTCIYKLQSKKKLFTAPSPYPATKSPLRMTKCHDLTLYFYC
jgi:hypothetical protein